MEQAMHQMKASLWFQIVWLSDTVFALSFLLPQCHGVLVVIIQTVIRYLTETLNRDEPST